MEGIFGPHVKSVDVVEVAVPGFGNDGERPPVAFHVGSAVLHLPGNDGVANDSYAMGIGNHDWAIEESRIVDPGCAGHLAIAVEGEPCRENGIVAGFATRMDGGDAGANWTLADFKFSL